MKRIFFLATLALLFNMVGLLGGCSQSSDGLGPDSRDTEASTIPSDADNSNTDPTDPPPGDTPWINEFGDTVYPNPP